MRKLYEHPAMQELPIILTSQLLTGTNIGEGEEGKEGDVKASFSWDVFDEENIFDENAFE